MLIKNALRIMSRFGQVEERQMGFGYRLYYLAGSPWSVGVLGYPDGKAFDFRLYLDGSDMPLPQKNLNACLRTAFSRIHRGEFVFLGKRIRFTARLLYRGAHLTLVAVLEVSTANAFWHVIESKHPQVIDMINGIIDGEELGPLLDWLQEHEPEEVSRLIRDIEAQG